MGEVKLKGGKDVPNANYPKKHYWWRYLLVWISATIVTLGLVAGGFGIAGFVVPMKNYLGFVGDPNEFLTPTYQDQSFYYLIKTIMSGDIDTLEDVNRITPKAESLFESINSDYIEPNLDTRLSWDRCKVVPFTKKDSYSEKDYVMNTSTTLPEFVVDELTSSIKVATLINIKGSPYEKLLTYFLYDVERDENGNVKRDSSGNPVIGRPYSLKDFMNKNNKSSSNAIEGIDADDIADNDFFKHVMDNVLDCAKITDLSDRISEDDVVINAIKDFTLRDIFDGKLNDLTIGQVLQREEDIGILTKLFKMTIKEVNEFDFKKAKFNDLLSITYAYDKNGKLIDGDISDYSKVYDANGKVIDKTTVSPLMLRTIGTFKINDVQDEKFLDSLKVGQFIGTNSLSDKALNTLAGYTFAEIKKPGFMDNRQLQEFIAIETDKSKPNYNPLLDAIKEWTFAKLKNDSEIKGIRLSSLYDVNKLDSKKDRTILALIGIDTDEKPVNLGNISERVNDIEIGKLMDLGDEPTRLTITISNKKLPDLAGLINQLTVKDVMDLEIGSRYHDTLNNKYYYRDSKGIWRETTYEEYNLPDYQDIIKKEGYYAGVDDDFINARILSGEGTSDFDNDDYGVKRGDLFDIRNAKISNPDEFIDEIKAKLKLDAVIDINSGSPRVLQNLAQYTLNDVPDALKKFTLGQLMDIPSNNKLLSALSGAVLFDPTNENYITNVVNNLRIEQIIDVGESEILKTLGKYTLGGEKSLSTLDLTKLKFNQIVSESEFIGEDKNDLLVELWGTGENAGNFTISDIPSRLNDCKLITILGTQIYEDPDDPTTGLLKPQWWYLLTSKVDYDTHAYTTEDLYRVDKLDSGKKLKLSETYELIDNITYHFANRTIGELNAAGFITISDPDVLAKVKDYTIEQVLAMVP